MLRAQIDYEGPESDSTWIGDGSNGKALEVLALAWIIRTAQELGLDVTVDAALNARPGLLYLRNVLPHSHPARAGHSDSSQHSTIEENFLAALTPKVAMHTGERTWSIFREGLPAQEVLDYVTDTPQSQDRPDLLVVEGQFETGINGQLVTSSWWHRRSHWRFSLRALDSPHPQIADCEEPLPCDFQSSALVEASLNKSTAHVDGQLESYCSKYGLELSQTLFFHGGSSHSTVAGLGISAATILDNQSDYTALSTSSKNWLAASLNL